MTLSLIELHLHIGKSWFMIQTKEDLHFYLEQDRKALGRTAPQKKSGAENDFYCELLLQTEHNEEYRKLFYGK